jgi:hypothetical protein
MLENKTEEWSKGLPFVQFYMNSTVHEGIQRSPYEAMFGTTMKMGLGSSFPIGDVRNVETERDLADFIKGMVDNGGEDSSDEDNRGKSFL